MDSYTNKPSKNDNDSDDAYQAQSDANILKQHQEITSDPDRHAAAHAHLQEQADTHQAAVKNSDKQMKLGKVKKGLAKAFGTGAGGKTPFQKAADGDK